MDERILARVCREVGFAKLLSDRREQLFTSGAGLERLRG
jgi:hypothetical protein